MKTMFFFVFFPGKFMVYPFFCFVFSMKTVFLTLCLGGAEVGDEQQHAQQVLKLRNKEMQRQREAQKRQNWKHVLFPLSTQVFFFFLMIHLIICI